MIKKKILITGSSGFLGKNLIKTLSKFKDFIIDGLVVKKNFFNKVKGVRYIVCDVSNLPKLKKKITEDYDIIINFAGNIDHQNKLSTKKIHYFGLKNLVSILQNNKSILFIQIGSSLEYGNVRSPILESFKCKPISVYGKSKYQASNYLKKNINNSIILRLFQVYGPLQKNNRLIPITINSCLKNKSFACSEGSQLRDFLYVEDFNELILKIINKKKIFKGIYNVGYGKPYKVKNIINLIQKKIKKGKPIFGKIKMRKDEVKILYPNIDKVKKIFKWKPKTNIFQGIEKTIKYYEK